jgi:hypothetical protein
MGRWRGFLDSLATTGGHIFILVFLILTGAGISAYGEMHGWMEITKIGISMGGPAFGALMMMYKPSGTNAEQIARAGAPYQPPQPPPASLQPAIVVADPPLPVSSAAAPGEHA